MNKISILIPTKERSSIVDIAFKSGVEVIAPGANVPFADNEIFFGPISEFTDQNISLLPDFISNCGMARVFAYLMQENPFGKNIHLKSD